MALPNTLKKLRIQKNWTQDYVGNKLNISRTTISKFETGRQVPAIEVLMRYAELFRIEADYLISELTLPGQSMEKKTPYLVKGKDDDFHLLQDLFRKNPKLKKLLLEIDKHPPKEQQRITDFLETFIKGLKKR
ncbi:helix-turn-helix domain-containing protein [Peribacillus cavernae]|nr:helix-turn-helix transcriptional regulator [Peribacillus cavernae]MDQ0218467.1 transcriptional regulator with XRE-family HTH domain [Peribacillus cavernae]